jgi:hypothetical protein
MALLLLLSLPVVAVTGDFPVFIVLMTAVCLILALDRDPLRR